MKVIEDNKQFNQLYIDQLLYQFMTAYFDVENFIICDWALLTNSVWLAPIDSDWAKISAMLK
jgi:hypothetical protein